ncbi:MAG: TauD/TfdA family dioxygenase, partial [Sinobacteraceae bacterium]|nr:TauD/TfdA family dioxygenase [Nevskiaceae bacterium]
FKVTLDPSKNEAAEYLQGTIHWHIDGATDDIPAKATLLTGHRLSPVGGQTEFCSLGQLRPDASGDSLRSGIRPHASSDDPSWCRSNRLRR